MTEKKEKEDSCPVGYFWNGEKCVPNTTPPPEEDHDPNGKKVEKDDVKKDK